MKEMKKFLLALLVVAVPMTFAACSDDDDPPATDYAAGIVGEYYGPVTVVGFPEGMVPAGINMEAEIKRTADNTITIALGDLKLEAMELEFGDITGVKVAGTSATNVSVEKGDYTTRILQQTVKVDLAGTTVVGDKLTLKAALDPSFLGELAEGIDEIKITVDAKKDAKPEEGGEEEE